MSQEIEIEFKNFLTKAQYEQLLIHFQVQSTQIVRQANHYFDTPTQHLKQLASGLRIREVGEAIECTLKERTAQHSHLETTNPLTRSQADDMLATGTVHAPDVQIRLETLSVPLHELALFGSLVTDRVELPYQGGLLVLDHSFYLHCEDYEVEYETTDESVGQQIFEQFLQQFNIEKQPTPKKIARFVNALQQKG